MASKHVSRKWAIKRFIQEALCPVLLLWKSEARTWQADQRKSIHRRATHTVCTVHFITDGSLPASSIERTDAAGRHALLMPVRRAPATGNAAMIIALRIIYSFDDAELMHFST